MAKLEIVNPLEDLGKDTKSKGKKNIFKDKKFLIIAGAVALVGLYAGFKKNKSNTDEETSVVIPTGYTGYPSASSDESLEYTASEILSDVTDVLNTYIAETDSKITDIQSSIDSSNSAVYDNINKMNNMVNETKSIVDEQAKAIEKQNAINQMMQNSDMYHYVTTKAEKDALHEANKQIADKYGFTFNEDDTYWYDENGKRVYQTVTQIQQSVNTSGSTVKSASSSSSVVSSFTSDIKNNNTAYQNLSSAINSGPSNVPSGLTIPGTSSSSNKGTSSSSNKGTSSSSNKGTSSSSSSKSTSSSSSKSTSSSSSTVQTQKSKDSSGRTVVYTNSGSGWQFAGYE